MPVVGTAGHVDHGKSTLVEALTGRDPDRWDEEKRRGLTIDLGFAWTTLDSGTSIGFVDVPGHERFIKNMLAGVDAIEVAIFVVAADEGWMPQSEEHLAVLDLLGVTNGVVAVTRADLVDDDTLELVMLDVDDRLTGTSLEGSPVIPTSAPTGRGLAQLRDALDEAVTRAVVRDLGRPRLWVDRAFTIEGAGTVVTGTLVGGTLHVDDSLTLFPDERTTRIRSIQSHEESAEELGPGNRAALNLAGADRESIERGSMLGLPGQWWPTSRFAADVRAVRQLGDPIREQGSFHLHAGTGSWPARIRLLEGETLTHSGAVVVDTGDVRLPLQVGDRFILREVGRQAVVAGGVVLDPSPPRRMREVIPVLRLIRQASSADETATALLEARGREDLTVLCAQSGGGTPDGAVIAGRTGYSARRVDQLLRLATREVNAFHEANPLRPGMPKASLAGRLRIPPEELEQIIGTGEELVVDGPSVRAVDFGDDLDDSARRAWETLQESLLSAGYMPPRRKEIDADAELIHALIRSGRLVEVSDELLYPPDTLDDVVAIARQMGDGITVAALRDRLEITRKYAVPLLEWMDARGITRRVGEERVFRPQRPDEQGPGDAPSR